MKEENISYFRAYYSDTDAYGVVWHGSYIRWMEAGRMEYLWERGICLDEIYEREKVLVPVIELDIKYRNSARSGDEIAVVTTINELKPHYIVLDQTIKDKNSDKIFATAKVKCVGVSEGNQAIVRTLDKLMTGAAV